MGIFLLKSMLEPLPEKIPEKKKPYSFYLWSLVGVFFLVNIILLVIPDSPDADALDQRNQEILDDQQAFDRLSFWQKFLTSQESPDSHLKPSLLDGLPIDAEYDESVVSVMVDNFVAARPQHSGIRAASIVYEALAEGGITRLMLLFPYQEIERVGPVRSARDYFVDLAEEYGGIYLHAGGSPLALEKLWESDSLQNLDEADPLAGQTYSFRDQRYYAPHNLFFDLLAVRERIESLGRSSTPTKQEWCFSELAPVGTTAQHLTLNFSQDLSSDSTVQFIYDAEQQNYKRYYGSKSPLPHTDQYDALQVAPSNVIVQITPSELIAGDEKERLSFHHIGSGKVFYFRNGVKIEGTWKKPSVNVPTEFFDLQGNPVCFLAGQTWIALLNDESLLQEE
jgi:hypothetical protein